MGRHLGSKRGKHRKQPQWPVAFLLLVVGSIEAVTLIGVLHK